MGLMHIMFSTMSNYGRQFAFALAPIPAYLPQYWTLCNTNDPVLQRRKNLLQASPPNSIMSGGSIDNNHNNNIPTSHPGSNMKRSISSELVGPAGNSSGGVASSSSKPITEGGFSSTSIMILLLSHVFRLQYFLVSAVMSTFFESDDDRVKSGRSSPKSGINNNQKADRIHFDLVMQSVVMIGIQLLLLSAVTRRKRLANKKKVDDDVDYEVTTTATVSQNSKSSSLSQTPFIWLYKPNQHWRWDTVHQHIELIFVIILVEYAICRYFLHPENTISYIQTVKNLSVFLESCLALPQMILNYKRKSTDGLSLLMVIGWVLGDLLKLAYFVVSSYKKVGEGNTLSNDHSPSSSSGMGAFMVGSIFALGLDSIVMMQLVKWYPTNEFKSLMKKVKNSLSLRWITSRKRDGKKMKRRISFDEVASP